MRRKVFLGVMAATMLLLVSGCGTLVKGKQESSKITIEKDKAKKLELKLNVGAGELEVHKGADDWVEGKIEYNYDKLKPKVSYKLKDDKGIGTIEQGNKPNNIKIGNIKNNWKLNLSNEIPIDLTVNSGASKTKLDLKGINLSGLDVKAGVGDITIDLSGKWKKGFDASLEMGVGKSTIILPKDVGVKIDSSKGIGNAEFVDFISKGNGVYVNEAYEKADVIINLNTDMGIGETIFKLQ